MPTKEETQEQWYSCPNCFAWKWGGPPHGEGHPCPQKVMVDQAYIDMMDAQRMQYIRTPASLEDFARSMKRLTGGEEDDD